MSDHSRMLVAEETSPAAVTDDSCTVKYIEIVPLDRPADDCKPEIIEAVVEVTPEDLQVHPRAKVTIDSLIGSCI